MRLLFLAAAVFGLSSGLHVVPLNASQYSYVLPSYHDRCNPLDLADFTKPVWQSPPVFQTDAVYISLSISTLHLPLGAYVVARTLTNETTNISTLLPSGGTPYSAASAPRVYANFILVELHATPTTVFCANHTLRLDAFSYTTAADLAAMTQTLGRREQICGADDSVHAVCRYDPSNIGTSMFTFSRPVVRITVGPNNPDGSELCTGWLFGSDGDVLTNNHCIATQAQAASAQFEFIADSTACNGALTTTCPGVVEAITSKLIMTNAALDYSLVRLNASLVAKYGYLQASRTPAFVGQPVYVPQHPRGGCKLVSYITDAATKKPVVITRLDAPPGCGKGGVSYNADTDGGSSGSPVISATDNTVVALHYCGAVGCNNSGIPILSIVADLNLRGLLPSNAVASTSGAPAMPSYSDPRVVASSQQPVFGPRIVFDGIIRRTSNSTKLFPTSVDQYEFTLDAPGLVMVDILSYEIDEVASVYVDLNRDCRFNFFDSNIYIFSRDPNVPTYKPYFNDDVDRVLHATDGKADGSVSTKDSYLLATLPKGSHVVAIGITNLAIADAMKGQNNYKYASLESCVGDNTVKGAEGTYRLTLSSTVGINVTKWPTPIPTTPICTTPIATLQAKCAAELQAAWGSFY
ncbi:hypothetical protein LEN26_007571 [Aphanomyces euteiches]|nr:hypothetical protein AeMF1_003285 [Aphanomyces euteiches]KAH9131901.1 hypothetical protein LEN26_007571 [Aphanomyces euteiches]KAH9192246.1 hypothetical protein AeNC1_005775 [Aphanomyces euteiches]